jgi:HEAT repeat protein
MDNLAADTVYFRANAYREAGDLAQLQELYAGGDAVIRRAVLNGLWGEPHASPEMGPGIVALAIAAMSYPAPGVRAEACSVVQNQAAWGVDVTPALEPLLGLLRDPDGNVRRMACYATGNVGRRRRRYDLAAHLPELSGLLYDPDIYVREPAAWALWRLSAGKRDIGTAVPALADALAGRDEYEGPRKQAAGALLHHARKSPKNAEAVRRAVEVMPLERERKEVRRFLEQLEAL